MAKFVKVILFLLFAVTLHCVASNLFTEIPVESQEHDFTYAAYSQKVTSAQLPYFPEGELSSAVQSHQIMTSRIQRINLLEYSMSLKALALKLSSREAVLVQHRGRLYGTTTSYYCHPSSEYYVFTLRRIII
ncbi:hypothetical protein [Bacteroides salyersiae]|jgi:hypothetical protein|uniref:hypothetical protein n=1 Tax=Bacteroides salyersiae TaxID=291644 RepID=UPI001C8B9080|nr:hypothetical protein [Bacteroides salyersiae]